jgi:DNA mismatch repair protein MutS
MILKEARQKGLRFTKTIEEYYNLRTSIPSDYILLFALGDFYEVLFDDARVMSDKLNLTLTHRGNLGESKIPMGGFPLSKLEDWALKLQGDGINFAIADQVGSREDGSKIREITDIITASNPLSINTHQEQRFNKCLIYKNSKSQITYVSIDTINLKFDVGPLFDGDMKNFLSEVISNDMKDVFYVNHDFSYGEESALVKEFKKIESVCSLSYQEGYVNLKQVNPQILKQGLDDETLKHFEMLSRLILVSRSFFYKKGTTFEFNNMREVTRSLNENSIKSLRIDSLESLFYEKYLKTPQGKREFSNRVRFFPEFEMTNRSHEYISELLLKPKEVGDLVNQLGSIINYRLMVGKTLKNKSNLRDFFKLGRSIESHLKVSKKLNIKEYQLNESFNKISNRLSSCFNEDYFITKEGFPLSEDKFPEYYELVDSNVNIKETLVKRELDLSKKCGFPCKIKKTQKNDITIEVNLKNIEKFKEIYPDAVLVKGLKNSSKFETKEMRKLSVRLQTFTDNLKEFEDNLIKELSEFVLSIQDSLNILDWHIAQIDCLLAFTAQAIELNLRRPEFLVERKVVMKNGIRCTQMQEIKNEDLVPLSIDAKNKVVMLTGPNGSGKSYLMRTMAELIVMSRIGGYVFNDFATYPYNHILTKLDTQDKEASTFQTEMLELSYVLNAKNKESILFLDEVGRGTTPKEGEAIAGSLLSELINNNESQVFFASHFLDVVRENSDKADCMSVYMNYRANPEEGSVEYLYEVVNGITEQAFGIYTAQTSGIPKSIINGAKKRLKVLKGDGN